LRLWFTLQQVVKHVGVAERRVREREQLRGQIVDAARDLLLEEGLERLSMRSIADRIEYSPATIYLHFRDKDELLEAVMRTGFERLNDVVMAELARAGAAASWAEQYGAMGRAYARFAVENPSYFRVMFELPATARAERCSRPMMHPNALKLSEETVRRAVEAGQLSVLDPRRTAIYGWGLIHGLTTLYLAGQLRDEVTGAAEFMEMIEDAMRNAYAGWRPDGSGGEGE
jgi:AcrR family transcriptional regulator